jgi:hypothetical protein
MTKEQLTKLLGQNQSRERNDALVQWAMKAGMYIKNNTPMFEVEMFIEKYLYGK